MSDLRACPFCGSKEKVKLCGYNEGKVWTVECRGCNSCSAWFFEQDGRSAAAAWNRREPDYERKWGELVETTGQRIAQDEKDKAKC